MRQLKYHEKKLLKKVNFLEWKNDNNIRENKILQRYHIADREDYHQYNKICGYITKLVNMLRKLGPSDQFRIKTTELLLNKCYSMGLISTKNSLEDIETISASTFARRRIATVFVMQKFCQEMKQAVMYIEQGHVRVGPDVITDPAFHVTRQMQDHLGWSRGSAIKSKVDSFNDQLDDYDALNA